MKKPQCIRFALLIMLIFIAGQLWAASSDGTETWSGTFSGGASGPSVCLEGESPHYEMSGSFSFDVPPPGMAAARQRVQAAEYAGTFSLTETGINAHGAGCAGSSVSSNNVQSVPVKVSVNYLGVEISSDSTLMHAQFNTKDGKQSIEAKRIQFSVDDETAGSMTGVWQPVRGEEASGNIIAGGEFTISGNGKKSTEICDNGRDDDANGQTDCEDAACKTAPICGPVHGKVYFIDESPNTGEAKNNKPIADAQMYLAWQDAGNEGKSSEPFYTDAAGAYSYDSQEIHAAGAHDFNVLVLLTNQNQTFIVSENSQVISDNRTVGKSDWAAGKPIDIVLAETNGEWAHPHAGGKVYYHTAEALDYLQTLLPKGMKFNSDNEEGSDIYNDSKGIKSAFHIDHADGGGIRYGTVSSNPASEEAPDNIEYHENSHHLMDVAYEKMPPLHKLGSISVDNNHKGTRNHCSSDSYSEGFAEFTALIVNIETKAPKRCAMSDAKPSFYCTGNYHENLEWNQVATADEEIAVAGILWDLYDNASVNGGADDDNISIPAPKLYQTLLKKRNFANYYTSDKSPRNIWYVKDLYDALIEDGYDSSAVNAIFKSHGYYYFDENTGKDVYGVTLWVSGDNGYAYSERLAKDEQRKWRVRE